MTISIRIALLSSLVLVACGGAAPEADESAAAALQPARYLDAVDYLSAEENGSLERWDQLQETLRVGFDNLCGDTFCEGDYSDLQSLDLRCSVEAKGGNIQSCIWALAGSEAKLTPSSGALHVTGKLYFCRLPVTGTIDALIQTLQAPGDTTVLERPLPGTTSSIYDALANCNLGQ